MDGTDKRQVDDKLEEAYRILKGVSIADEDDKIDKTWRGQISAFGAAITMGSLQSAVAYFGEKGGSSVERPKLLEAIQQLVAPKAASLAVYVATHHDEAAERKIINAILALKLAMNRYTLTERCDDHQQR